ncbi:S41 family peptidase [Bacteroidota bacterium]
MKTLLNKFTCLILVLVLFFNFSYADKVKFLRYPHINNGKIAFSYHGDIWIANDDGSAPRRLTAHVADDVFPRFSPDGKLIAFTSNRMGNKDIFIIPVEGGEPRQLTFHSTGDDIQYWTPDGKSIIFSSNRSEKPFYSPLYIVSINGGLPMPMDMDQGKAGMISQDGSKIAFNRIGFTYWRKGYMGTRNTDVFVQNLKSKEIIQLTDIDLQQYENFRQDAFPMWGADGYIYFLSERNNIFNIWKISPDGGNPEQVTFHKKDGIQYPSISPDGKEIIYENEFELWKLKLPDGKPQKINIELAFDLKENIVEYLKADSKADGYYPSPEGDYSAVDFHGEIYIIPVEKDIGEITQVTSNSYREHFQVYSPDGKKLAYISDKTGEEEIWVYDLETKKQVQLTKQKSMKGRRYSRGSSSFIWSKNSETIALSAGNKLFLIDVENASEKELGYHESGGYSLHEFSPDGKWIVMTLSDKDQNSDVYLYNIDEKKAYNVTENPFRDLGGALTPDAKYIIFSSSRNSGINQLFKVPLQKLNEDPADPLVRERLMKVKKPKGKKDETSLVISLDIKDIKRRAIAITTGNNSIGSFFLSKDGQTIYFTSSDDKGPGLFSINLDGEKRKKITDGRFGGLIPTADRSAIFYSQSNNVYKMKLSDKKKEKLTFDFTVNVDKRIEWKQIFEESWRIMKYYFYDEKMHGRNWESIKKDYEPLLKYVGQNQDVYDLSNEMIGELNASHTGVRGPTRKAPTTYSTKYPGFELTPENGKYKISHIYRDGPADKDWIDINVGDYVLEIEGKEINAGDNYWKILNHTLNDYVNVKISSEPKVNSSSAKNVRVKTVSSMGNIKYNEWVKNNREIVDKLSGGKIAYVHIRSMNQSSLRIFENEINQFSEAKGIIIDIRYNGGGNTDQGIIDILKRTPFSYWNNRWGDRSWGRRPRQAIAGPKVMMINSRSASDSEVTSRGFHDLGLGRIVGNPTMAACIATGSYRLINGASIRTPGSLVTTYDPSKPNNYGINLENFGVPPDVFVENTPEEELKGFDRELKTAVEEALKMLKEGKWQYEKK